LRDLADEVGDRIKPNVLTLSQQGNHNNKAIEDSDSRNRKIAQSYTNLRYYIKIHPVIKCQSGRFEEQYLLA
jgi:hypothetical protein